MNMFSAMMDLMLDGPHNREKHSKDPLRSGDLIHPGDPPPYRIVNQGGEAPVLLVCDHASRKIPAHLNNLGLDQSALDRHIAYDIGAAAVTRRLSEALGAPAVLAGYSRLLIDCNRQPGDPHSIPETSDNHAISGNANLTGAEVENRHDAFFWPYHRAIAETLSRLRRRGPVPAFFSIHSFTPSLGGEDRYWDIGVLWNRDPRLAVPLMEKLRAFEDGLHVGDNEPYSGREIAYTLDIHGGAGGLPNCAVEIRQDLLETEAGIERWSEILSEALGHVLAMDNLHRVERF